LASEGIQAIALPANEATAMKFPGPPIRRGAYMQRQEIDQHPDFMDRCLALFDRGHDTKDISMLLFQPEFIVESAVRIARERRRRPG